MRTRDDLVIRGGREQSAAGSLPDCHDQTVADADHRLWPRRMRGEPAAKVFFRLGQQSVDDMVVDIDDRETWLLFVRLLADDLGGGGTGAGQAPATGSKKPDCHGEAVERSRGDARTTAHPAKVTYVC